MTTASPLWLQPLHDGCRLANPNPTMGRISLRSLAYERVSQRMVEGNTVLVAALDEVEEALRRLQRGRLHGGYTAAAVGAISSSDQGSGESGVGF